MNDLAQEIEALQDGLVATATHTGGLTDEQFQRIRKLILDDSRFKAVTPEFIRTCRTSDQFWEFIKREFAHYSERRRFIWDSLRPLLELAERVPNPSDEVIHDQLRSFDSDTVHAIWAKALERRDNDPEGAITAARTLLESVCKHILDDLNIVYAKNPELPDLYKSVAKELNLAPSQHTETIFKQILGGCTAVVEGLGALRNRLGDAHGQGKLPVKPAPRHAELSVNLAGAVATFLVSTHLSRGKN
jgi:hypothetical protein